MLLLLLLRVAEQAAEVINVLVVVKVVHEGKGIRKSISDVAAVDEEFVANIVPVVGAIKLVVVVVVVVHF